MSSLGLILLFMLGAAPQTNPQHPSRDQAQTQTQRDPRKLERYPEIGMLQNGTYDDHTCFTLRTYYFKRQDGKAPEMVGTSTCTPASVLRREQAKRKPPKVMLVPLKDN